MANKDEIRAISKLDKFIELRLRTHEGGADIVPYIFTQISSCFLPCTSALGAG